MGRESVTSEENWDGKLFVLFIAFVIYQSYLKKAMDTGGLFKNYTMLELIDESDINELFQQPGEKHHLGEITEKQKKFYASMSIDGPA